jgi:signal transduction histidine kinase
MWSISPCSVVPQIRCPARREVWHRLDTRCRAERGVYLHGDALRLRQIVIKLFSNAVKFSDPGGAVRVLVEDRGREGFVLSVSDSGVGMRPEDIPKALEPYGQVRISSKRKQGGIGLGLPLAKALSEKHAGVLEIDSAIGKDTTVRICLPAARRCAVSAPTKSDAGSA